MVIRQVDKLGRICLPITYRKQLDLAATDSVEMLLTEDEIIIRKHFTLDENVNRLISLEQSLCHDNADHQEELHQLFEKIHSFININEK